MPQLDDGPVYEVYAIRYATNPRRTRGNNFILEERPTEPLTLDFFSWVIIGDGKVFVVDTGMDPEKARKHGHDVLVSPIDALMRLGVRCETVDTVIMTHLHYDHTGHIDAFPAAKFLLQADEMAYVTGPYMEQAWFRRAYEVDEITQFLRYLHDGRLHLHGRDHVIADGISAHWVGGHCAGQEVVRVRTARGWIVLASDALHYYEEIERGIPFAVAFNLSDMITAHDKIRELADSAAHIIPGHDPKVMDLYPAANTELNGIAVRLDVPPNA
jgi:glyoxylase-like metal-dependent hydrolase (beta-lactamase superfamily II)